MINNEMVDGSPLFSRIANPAEKVGFPLESQLPALCLE
jgi:hypothetical protein